MTRGIRGGTPPSDTGPPRGGGKENTDDESRLLHKHEGAFMQCS